MPRVLDCLGCENMIYSPSQTTAFMDNPMYREICYREGWHPITMRYPDRALVAGGGFNEGVLWHYRGQADKELDPACYTPGVSAEMAVQYIKDRLAHIEKQGFQWKEDVDPGDLVKTVSVAVARYIDADPLPRPWLVAVEPYLKAQGYVKPDLVLRSPHLTPLDIKFKLTLDEDRLAQTIAEYSYSWQFMHYVWATEQHYGEPVRNSGLILVRARPFKVWTEFFPVDPELLEIWKTSAKSVWAVMAAVDGEPDDLLQLIADYRIRGLGFPPWLTFKWYGRYGRDPMTAAVLDHKLDEGLMQQSYIKTGGD